MRKYATVYTLSYTETSRLMKNLSQQGFQSSLRHRHIERSRHVEIYDPSGNYVGQLDESWDNSKHLYVFEGGYGRPFKTNPLNDFIPKRVRRK